MGCISASAVAAPPTATTEAAIAVSYEQATLKGTVNPEGSATTYYFEYGTTETYGTQIPVSPESVGSGTSNVAVSQTPAGLSQSTTYHFRVVAEGEATTKGEDLTFTTAGFNFEFGEEGSGNGQLKQPTWGLLPTPKAISGLPTPKTTGPEVQLQRRIPVPVRQRRHRQRRIHRTEGRRNRPLGQYLGRRFRQQPCAEIQRQRRIRFSMRGKRLWRRPVQLSGWDHLLQH